MGTFYDMAIRLSMTTTGMTAGANAAIAMMQRLHTQAGLTGTQIDKLGKSLAMLGTGAAITGVGVGLLGFMDSAVKKAMELQTIAIGIQTRTGASTAQMAALQTRATNIGMTNQMSTNEVMGVAQSASRAGITNVGQLSQMLKPLTNYAEVMLRATGADPSHSATIAVEMAHLFGAFGNKQIGGMSDTAFMVNQLGKAMQIVPGSQDQFLRLLSQFVGTERPLYKGKPPQALISDTISEATLLSQMGQGQRGGNQIARIITAMMGGARGKSAQAAIAGIQRGTGIPFANAQGQIQDPSLLLKALATTAQKLNPSQTLKEFSAAFQQNGARLAGLFSDPIVGTRLKAIADAMKAMPDLGAQQRRYNQSASGQFNQAGKNFDSAMTQLGILWLPIATAGANALAAFTANLIRFTQQHPQMTKLIAGFIAVTAAVALVVGPILMLVGLIGAASVGFEVLGGVVAAIATIGFAPFLVIILAVGAALVGITLVVLNFGKIMHEVGAGIHNLMVMLGLVHAPAVPTIPKGGAPPASQVQGLQLRHNHEELARGNKWYYQDTRTNKWIPDGKYTPGKGTGGGGGAVWDMSIVQRRTQPVWDMPIVQRRGAQGAAPVLHLHIAPGAVGPIHVHGADHHDEEALAARVGAHVVRDLGDELVHTLTSGAPSVFGLSPVLNVPTPR